MSRRRSARPYAVRGPRRVVETRLVRVTETDERLEQLARNVVAILYGAQPRERDNR